jgi:hypothetical protein
MGRGRAGAAVALYPRVGFIVTDMSRPSDRVATFCNHRGTAEQWIKEGRDAVTRTMLSCRNARAQMRRPKCAGPNVQAQMFRQGAVTDRPAGSVGAPPMRPLQDARILP